MNKDEIIQKVKDTIDKHIDHLIEEILSSKILESYDFENLPNDYIVNTITSSCLQELAYELKPFKDNLSDYIVKNVFY